MRVQDIIQEMAWSDKFNPLEQKVRDENMTIEELAEYLYSEFDVFMMFLPGGPPHAIGGGGLTPRRVTHEFIDEYLSDMSSDVKNKVLDKFLLSVNVGPGVERTSPVAEVRGLLHVLRHELAHVQQAKYIPHDKHARMSKKYIQPGYSDPGNRIMYVLQPLERSQQALDFAAHLTTMSLTPDLLQQAIQFACRTFDKRSEITAQEVMQVGSDILQQLSSKDFDDDRYHLDVTQLSVLVGGMGLLYSILPEIASTARGKYKGQTHQFFKLLNKRFPKVKAYMKKHQKHEDAAWKNTEEKLSFGNRFIEEMTSIFNRIRGRSSF